MAKIPLDKYYTQPHIAEYCVKKTKSIIGIENISRWIEPSAGAGVFLEYLDGNYDAFDIEPEHGNVTTQNYLELLYPYRKGACIIGNPPFGARNTLSVAFYKKSITIGDFVAFILPASQYNNNQQMYQFDLIHSELLPITEYSGVKLQCCFNIYKRPEAGINTAPIDYRMEGVTVLTWGRGGSNKAPDRYDMGICAWGSIGKEIKYQGQFALEHYIIVNNTEYKDQIIDAMKNANWRELYPNIATPRLGQWKIYKYLRQQIPNLN